MAVRDAIREVITTDKFEQDIKHIREALTLERIEKQIRKIVSDPEVGKPLKYSLKGERTLYIKPYRLIYAVEGSTLILLRFEHRKDVYE